MRITTRIIDTGPVTHDVKYFRLEKPPGYRFQPGQATDVSISKKGWEEELRPFTFTSLNEAPYLEFTIKRYTAHHGVTDQLHQLKPGEEIIIGEPWGAIEYKGPGYFIAGGAGITPFIAILRQLHKQKQLSGNRLFFSNKTSADIIYENELKEMLGPDAVFILSRENAEGYKKDRIDKSFIQKNISDFQKPFYICGPDPMVAEIADTLRGFGVTPESLVFEK